ncbi:MAG: DNA (cytosine-5-)-methyltransferase, partial [Deinococcales bacterium]
LPNDSGAVDSHRYHAAPQLSLFGQYSFRSVKDILENNPDVKYDCSPDFTRKLEEFFKGDLEKLHGMRLIDTRHGNSIHSWDIAIKGECTVEEVELMNSLIANRRKHIFGKHQDGKALTIEQIKHFYPHQHLYSLLKSLIAKGYLSEKAGKYNPVCGNMSFEVFKFLDPESISITLTASDAHKLGVYHCERVRRLTPRECARLQGYPEDYKLHPDDRYAYKQLGNAVSIPVIKKLFLDFLENNSNFVLKTDAMVSVLN